MVARGAACPVGDGSAALLGRLAGIVEILPAEGAAMARTGDGDWAPRDPFDRIIVATAQIGGAVAVSKGAALDAAPGGLWRIW